MATAEDREPVHRREDWLRRKYHGEGLTQAEMAEEAGVCQRTISVHMQQNGVDATRITEADILADIRSVAEELGRRPTWREWRERTEYSWHPVRDRFGTWSEALVEALGEEDDDGPVYADPEWLEARLGEGGMEDAAEAAGVSRAAIHYHADKHGLAGGGGRVDVGADELRRLYWAEGMTLEEVGDELGVSAGHASRLMQMHGLETRGSGLADERLLRDIRGLAMALGEEPSRTDYEKHGAHAASTVARRFGTWAEGRDLALRKDS